MGEVPQYENLLQRLAIFLGTRHQTTVLFEEDHLVFNRPPFKIWMYSEFTFLSKLLKCRNACFSFKQRVLSSRNSQDIYTLVTFGYIEGEVVWKCSHCDTWAQTPLSAPSCFHEEHCDVKPSPPSHLTHHKHLVQEAARQQLLLNIKYPQHKLDIHVLLAVLVPRCEDTCIRKQTAPELNQPQTLSDNHHD